MVQGGQVRTASSFIIDYRGLIDTEFQRRKKEKIQNTEEMKCDHNIETTQTSS